MDEDKKEVHVWDMCLMLMGIVLLVSEVVGLIGKKSKSITVWIGKQCGYLKEDDAAN